MKPVLVVGYGNPLRGDDGIGWRAVDALRADTRLAHAEVVARHQLTPELADDVARAALVVLIDAHVGLPGGEIAVTAVHPAGGGYARWSHGFDPGALLGLEEMLHGTAPPAFLVSIGAASTDVGEDLSPAVEQALPTIVEAVADVVARHAGNGAPGGSSAGGRAPAAGGGGRS